MKFSNPLIVVSNMENSKQFYDKVLELKVIVDFGGNVSELYFEEDDFDGFLQKINDIEYINYVHTMIEHSCGQCVIRFYDPDNHIIEVGENIIMVVIRFLNSGLSIEEAAIRMDVPVDYVKSCLK